MNNELFWIVCGATLLIAFAIFYAIVPRPKVRVAIANSAITVFTITLCLDGVEMYLRLRERPSAIAAVPAAKEAPVATAPAQDQVNSPESQPLVIRNGDAEISLPSWLVAHMNKRRDLLTMPENFAQKAV